MSLFSTDILPSLQDAFHILDEEISRRFFMSTSERVSSKIHPQQQDVLTLSSSTSVLVSEPVMCDICGKELASFEFLKVHQRKVHGVSQLGPKSTTKSEANSSEYLSCNICHSNIHREALVRHRVFCKGMLSVSVLSHQCDLCSAVFTSKSHLNRHRQGMHENITFACTCGASFRWRTSLKNHMRRCPMCPGSDQSGQPVMTEEETK